MNGDFSQGDIIQIYGFRQLFLIVSKNAFISATGVFHVCPLLQGIEGGPLHIEVRGIQATAGTVLCEQIKLIDPAVRKCMRKDRIAYSAMMNISDALQGIFEYD